MKVTWMLLCISWLTLVYTSTHIYVWIQPIQTLSMISSQLWVGKNSMAKSLNPSTQCPKAPGQTSRCTHATIETGVFGTEFVAMKTGVDMLRVLRYKLRMMGVAIDSTTHVYGDIMSIIKNTSKPETTLNKKSNAVCYLALSLGKPLWHTYLVQKTQQTL
ncbi:hypothetical protein ACHAXS_000964 [Conticribra weissflogii]